MSDCLSKSLLNLSITKNRSFCLCPPGHNEYGRAVVPRVWDWAPLRKHRDIAAGAQQGKRSLISVFDSFGQDKTRQNKTRQDKTGKDKAGQERTVIILEPGKCIFQ